MRRPVLIVAQTAELRGALARAVRAAGYPIELAESRHGARELIARVRFGLAIVAAGQFGASGMLLARELLGSLGGVVLVAERHDQLALFTREMPEANAVLVADIGDGHLTDIIRRAMETVTKSDDLASVMPEVLWFSGRALDTGGRTFLDAEGREVALTRSEFSVLLTFARNPGRVLTRDRLRRVVDRGEADTDERAIDMLISRLRRKIEPDPKVPRLILTVPGSGYKFAAQPGHGRSGGKPGELTIPTKAAPLIGDSLIAHRTLRITSGFAASETDAALGRARALAAQVASASQEPCVIYAQWIVSWTRALYDDALSQALALLRWGEEQGSLIAQTFGHCALGETLLPKGDFAGARRHLEAAIALNRFSPLAGDVPVFAEDVARVGVLSHLHNCLFLMGWPVTAETIVRPIADDGTGLRRPFSRAILLLLSLRRSSLRRDAVTALQTSRALLDLATEQGYPDYVGVAMSYQGWAVSASGMPQQGIEIARGGIGRCREHRFLRFMSHQLLLLAECHASMADAEGGLRVLDEAEAHMTQTGERFLEAELFRLRGEMLDAAGHAATEAARWFQRALDTAHGQQARLLELRAAHSLARFQLAHHRCTSVAFDELSRVYNSLGEKSDCADIDEARAVLELAPHPAMPGDDGDEFTVAGANNRSAPGSIAT